MRTEEFWIDALDQFGNVTAQFQPEQAGQITASTATIARALTGLILPPDETLATNTRLRVMVAVDGVEYALGVFLPTLGARHQTDLGVLTEVNGHDLGFLLSQTTSTGFGTASGDVIADRAADLVTLTGITDVSYPDYPDMAGTYMAWPPGAPIIDILDTHNRLLGVVTAVDRTGTVTARTLPYIGVDAPTKSWQAGDASELQPGAVEVDDLWSVPNTWWVTSSTGDVALAGKYELPDDHAMSFVSRGFRQTVTMDVPGLTTTAACEERARDEAQRDPNVHSTVELSCALDPTLEPWDVATYKDADWIVESFNLDLKVGAGMKVRLRESLVA